MTIGIDLNDVLRDFSRGFALKYWERVDRTINPYDIKFTTNDYRSLFYFPNDNDYHYFLYSENAFELFGTCAPCKHTVDAFSNFYNAIIANIDTDEPVDVMIVSPMEYGIGLQGTLHFLSKFGCQVRNYYFPTDSSTIWDKCDIVVTANPSLLVTKPEGKVSIKIETDYNTENDSDYSYANAAKFLKDKETIENIVLKYGK